MVGFLSEMTVFLHSRLCWRCILFADQFEFFCILIGSSVLHSAQFVQLLESEFGFTQLTQVRLCVVGCNILIACWRTVVNFIQDHAVFIILLARPLVHLHQVKHHLLHLEAGRASRLLHQVLAN
jgi:hypothetical protein